MREKIIICCLILGMFFIRTEMCAAEQPIILQTLAQETAPKWIMESENGHSMIGGLCADILKSIERKNDKVRFSWQNEFYPLKRMLIFLEERKIQLIVSMGYNAKRAEKFIYSEPLYDVYHVVAVRKDDPIRISSFADIAALGNKGTILTVTGSATGQYLKNRPERLIIDEGGKTPTANLKKLITNKGRFFYYYDYGLYYATKMGEFKDKVNVLPVTFRKYQHYIIFSKTVPLSLIEEINTVIRDMKKSGEMDKIRYKYR